MSTSAPAPRSSEGATEQAVVEYLYAHPDFFARHDDLLAAMRISHAVGGAVSLIQHQVKKLRGEVEALQRREREMRDLARENEHLHGKIHRFTLQMIGARSVSEVMDRVRAFLEDEFQAEPAVALLSESVAGTSAGGAFCRRIAPGGAEFAAFDACLKSDHALCGRLKNEQLRILFGERAVEIRSAAFIPLGKQGALGMLAIGSLERDRFDDHMGTVFLDNMAEVIAQAITAHDGANE